MHPCVPMENLCLFIVFEHNKARKPCRFHAQNVDKNGAKLVKVYNRCQKWFKQIFFR